MPHCLQTTGRICWTTWWPSGRATTNSWCQTYQPDWLNIFADLLQASKIYVSSALAHSGEGCWNHRYRTSLDSLHRPSNSRTWTYRSLRLERNRIRLELWVSVRQNNSFSPTLLEVQSHRWTRLRARSTAASQSRFSSSFTTVLELLCDSISLMEMTIAQLQWDASIVYWYIGCRIEKNTDRNVTLF